MDNHEHVTLAYPSHPGEILRDCIAGHGATVTGTAQRLQVSRAKLNRILAGRGRIGPDTALALERLGWSAAEFWLRLQMKYDLAVERRKQAA